MLNIMQTIDEIIAEELAVRLAVFNGDRKKVADTFGVSYKTLYNWCHKYFDGLLPLDKATQEALADGQVVVLRPEDYRGSRQQVMSVIKRTYPKASFAESGSNLIVKTMKSKVTKHP